MISCSKVLVPAGLMLLAGCGSILTFKPGAGPGDMAADEHACGQAGDEGFLECMRQLGWYVHDNSAPAAPAAAAAPAQSQAATSSIASTVQAAPPARANKPASRSAVAASAPTASATAASASPVAAKPSSGAAALPPTVASVGVGSLPQVRVGSWWKMGGTAAGLDGSIAACVEKLGAPHRPSPGAIVVTVALQECLRADGWYANGVTAVTSEAPPQ